MRASRSLSTRLASIGSALAITTLGLAGAAGIVATAGPAGAGLPGTSVGTTNCALSAPAGETPITANITASVNPSPVNQGNVFNIAGLELYSNLVANATTTVAAGETLSVTFTTQITATNATPGSQTATFTGSVTLPKPFPVGAQAQISLPGSVGSFTANAGATSTQVFFNPSGHLVVALGSLPFSGDCTGSAPVQIASAPIIPAAGVIQNVIPNSGVSSGGTTVKLVGQNFLGATAVHFGSAAATNVRVLSPSVILCTSPAGANYPFSTAPSPGDGNTHDLTDVTVTTAAGPSKKQPNDEFTWTDPTLGTIVTGVTPVAGTAAGGNAVVIHGIGFNGYNDPGSGPAFAVDFGSVNQPNYTVVNDTTITTTAPPGSGIVNVTVVGYDESTPSVTSPADRYNYNPGYFLGASDGGIFSFGQVPGNAGYFGSAGGIHLNKPIVGMALTPDGGGYWLVASDGGVFAYGDATFYGSTGNITLNKPMVGIAPTPDGAGYWLVASDGGVFGFGDAIFQGSTGGKVLAAPVVGIAATASGNGYWLVAQDGGVFAFGDAPFYGSTGGIPLAAPMVGIAPVATGGGYWLVGSDGGVFAYGSAGFHGSLHGTPLTAPISGIASTATGNGYWLFAQGGGVFNEGDAGFYGDMAGIRLNGPVVGFGAVQSAPLAA